MQLKKRCKFCGPLRDSNSQLAITLSDAARRLYELGEREAADAIAVVLGCESYEEHEPSELSG